MSSRIGPGCWGRDVTMQLFVFIAVGQEAVEFGFFVVITGRYATKILAVQRRIDNLKVSVDVNRHVVVFSSRLARLQAPHHDLVIIEAVIDGLIVFWRTMLLLVLLVLVQR